MGIAFVFNVGQGQPLIEQQPLRERILETLQKHAYAIASIALIIIATVVTAIVACGIVHPAVIAVAVLGILAAGIAGYFAVSSIYPKTPMPKPFLEEIRLFYGNAMYNFIVEKGVTIQELRGVMRWVNSRFSAQLEGSAKTKAESFGLDKLKKDASKKLRPNFDDFLTGRCPAYLVKRFIALGDPQFPQAKGMSPESYWTSSLGFVDDTYTAFDTRTWFLAKVMKEEEHTLLREFMKNGLWHQTAAVVSDLQTRMLNRLEQVPQWRLFQDNGDPVENINKDSWFRRLFDHGVSWDQIRLLGKLDIMFLGLFEGVSLTGYSEDKLLTVFNESDENYDHEEALLCGQEMILPTEE
ncbi:DUF1389 domain-containing protein [Chlamydia vaughanii]|uniref:DUF1389 domain-containing protein n=1 Tax=Chlamydia vaughanii TaxID=3112552 RepID=UPI0032B149F6